MRRRGEMMTEQRRGLDERRTQERKGEVEGGEERRKRWGGNGERK